MSFLESDDEDEESLPAGYVPDPIIEPKVIMNYFSLLLYFFTDLHSSFFVAISAIMYLAISKLTVYVIQIIH